MDGWTEMWLGGWKCQWIDGDVDGWLDGDVVGWRCGWMVGHKMGGWMEMWMDGDADRCITQHLAKGPMGEAPSRACPAEDPVTDPPRPPHPPVETKMLAMMTNPARKSATMSDTRRPT